MTAKEMFENLGYTYNECCFQNDLGFDSELDEIYYQKKGKYTPQIKFSLGYKTISVYRENYKPSSFDIKLLKAINKQAEELGWNNENN